MGRKDERRAHKKRAATSPKLPPDANCELQQLSQSWSQSASTIKGFTVLKAVFTAEEARGRTAST